MLGIISMGSSLSITEDSPHYQNQNCTGYVDCGPVLKQDRALKGSGFESPFCSDPFSKPFYSYLHTTLKEIPCAPAEGWVSHERVCGTHWVTWEKGTSGNAMPSMRRKPHQGMPPVLPKARISTVQVFYSTETKIERVHKGLCSSWRTLPVPTHGIPGSGS